MNASDLPLLHVAPLLLLLACSGSTSGASHPADGGGDGHVAENDSGAVSVGVSGFDVSCQKAADCVLVEVGQWTLGDACCGVGCPAGAINASAQAAYGMALSHLQAECKAALDGAVVGCGVDCIAVEAVCNAGTCGVCMGGGCADAGTGGGDAGAD